jgi:uncharacterized membrane protein
MTPGLMILAVWLLFGGSHLLLSASTLRALLTDRFGPAGFTIIFSFVTAVTMTALIVAVAVYGDQGRPGLGLAGNVFVRWGLMVIAFLGAVLAMSGLVNYARSPMAKLAERRQENAHGKSLAPPTAIERVTRHPFFVGLIMLMAAHALLASTLAGFTYFAGFVVMALIGMPLQDRKLRKRWGALYGDFEEQTSVIPLAPGQKPLPEDQDPGQDPEWRKWIISLLLAIVFFGLLHPVMAYANGAVFAALILVFGVLAAAKRLLMPTGK